MNITVSKEVTARALQVAAEFDDRQWSRGYDAVDANGRMANILPAELAIQTGHPAENKNYPVAWCLNGRLQVGLWTALRELHPRIRFHHNAAEVSLAMAQLQTIVRAALKQHTKGSQREVMEAGIGVWNDCIATGPGEVRVVLSLAVAQVGQECQA